MHRNLSFGQKKGSDKSDPKKRRNCILVAMTGAGFDSQTVLNIENLFYSNVQLVERLLYSLLFAFDIIGREILVAEPQEVLIHLIFHVNRRRRR